MSILLAERAVRRVTTTIQANLAAEITATLADLLTDFGETLTLAPAGFTVDYYRRPKSVIAGGTLAVEVYEREFEITNPYVDVDCERAVYDVPIVVKATLFNRDGASADTMITRSRLLGAALFRTILEHSELTGADGATRIAVPTGYSPSWDFAGEDAEQVLKVQVTIPALVQCEEVT